MVHVSVQSCQNLWCSTTASPEFPWSCFRNCWSTVSAALSGYAYSINWTVPYFFLSVISLCLLFDDGLYQPNFIKSKLLSKWTRIKCQNSSVSSRLLLNTDLDTSDYTFKFGLLRGKHYMNTTTCLLHQLLFFFHVALRPSHRARRCPSCPCPSPPPGPWVWGMTGGSYFNTHSPPRQPHSISRKIWTHVW